MINFRRNISSKLIFPSVQSVQPCHLGSQNQSRLEAFILSRPNICMQMLFKLPFVNSSIVHCFSGLYRYNPNRLSKS